MDDFKEEKSPSPVISEPDNDIDNDLPPMTPYALASATIVRMTDRFADTEHDVDRKYNTLEDDNDFDLASDVACKAGVTGWNATDEHKQAPSDLSSLATNHTVRTTAELNVVEVIDKALGIYYDRMRRNDYTDASVSNTHGKFWKQFQEQHCDPNGIEHQLANDQAAANCVYLKFAMFAQDFPMRKRLKNEQEVKQEQFRILRHCWMYGVPPLTADAMPKQILLIHGYAKQCRNDASYALPVDVEQWILIFVPHVEIHWQTMIDHMQRIQETLKSHAKWDLLDSLSCIIPEFLYLGAEEHAADVEKLQELGITHVLNCAANDVMDIKYPESFFQCTLLADDAAEYNIIHSDIAKCLQFVSSCKESKGRVLVHCLAGMNRSAAVTVVCMMYFKAMDLLSAIQFVQQRRGWILSNESFRQQLVLYAAKLDLL